MDNSFYDSLLKDDCYLENNDNIYVDLLTMDFPGEGGLGRVSDLNDAEMLIDSFPLGGLDHFNDHGSMYDQQNISDGSLNDPSPTQSTSSISYQHSPGSDDSGIVTSIGISSPDMSPNFYNNDYINMQPAPPQPQLQQPYLDDPRDIDKHMSPVTQKIIQDYVMQLMQQNTKENQQQQQQQQLLLQQQKQKQHVNIVPQQPQQQFNTTQLKNNFLLRQELSQQHNNIQTSILQPQQPQQQQIQQQPIVADTILQNQQLLLQQQLLQIQQQQQQKLIAPVAKTESQIFKILCNKKNNIVSALQGKKDKTNNTKNTKANEKVAKTNNKRKLPEEKTANIVEDVKEESKSPLTMLLMKKPAKQHAQQPINDGALSQPLLTDKKTNDKVAISRLNTTPASVSVSPQAKKTRVEHVVIEKRYRMKITDSLNELKNLLPSGEDAKSTKNGILQSAIDEIRRLQKENKSLKRKNDKLMQLYAELRKLGIIPNTSMSSSNSESNVSDGSSTNNEVKEEEASPIEPEIQQDHYVSPLQRQSARDGAKFVSCMAVFMFLFISPLNGILFKSKMAASPEHYSSRHLLSVEENSQSAAYWLVSHLTNIVLSLFFLMIMLLRGNPKCPASAQRTQCFHSQMNKAQLKLNKHEFEEARSFLRIGLFVVGNSCPKTTYGQIASFSWKCLSHILFQLGVLTTLKSIGRSILPYKVSSAKEESDIQFTSKLSAKAYLKLHEIAVKDKSSSYVEVACYIMNAIYDAEVSGDEELLCTAYATAVVHMCEKVPIDAISYLLQLYFTSCAHHVSLASKSDKVFAVDWIFESRGYGFFSSNLWDVKRKPLFHVADEKGEMDELNLLQIVYCQFQEFLLMKALKRIVVPGTWYPNEGKVELYQRSISFLDDLGTGPLSEQIDATSIQIQCVYAWWGSVMRQFVVTQKTGVVDSNDLQDELCGEINAFERRELFKMTKMVFGAYNAVLKLQTADHQLHYEGEHARLLEEAAQMTEEASTFVFDVANEFHTEETSIKELLIILCSDLISKSAFSVWEMSACKKKTLQQLHDLHRSNELVRRLGNKYPDLLQSANERGYEALLMSGANRTKLQRQVKKCKQIKTIAARKDDINNFYLTSYNFFPLKQDGFL